MFGIAVICHLMINDVFLIGSVLKHLWIYYLEEYFSF